MRQGWRRHFIFAGMGAVALAAGLGSMQLFNGGWIRFNYPRSAQYPVQGIDVSHHQGQIDWAQVAKAPHIKFAIIKATEGGDYRDPQFGANWRAAGAAGLLRGAYHFFTFCRAGIDQARNFLAAAEFARDSLPPIVDLEFGGNCNRVPTQPELAAELSAFLTAIAARDGRKPIFYATAEFRDAYLGNGRMQLLPHHLWIRDLFAAPPGTPCADWTMWQYANNGRVPGIATPVDLNAFCGTAAALAAVFGLPAGKYAP